MNRRGWLWPLLGTMSLLCTALLLLGFGWALKDTWSPGAGMALPAPTAAPEQAAGDWTLGAEVKAVAFGDSLTRGVGDASGQGYAAESLALLEKALGKPVKLNGNLAISGLEAGKLVELLEDKTMQDAAAEANIILLTIGGNDLFRSAQGGGSIAEGSGIDPAETKRRLPELEERLASVFGKLRAASPHATIAYVALYNPFYELEAQRAQIADILDVWNDYAEQLAAADGNIVVVPTADLFRAQSRLYLSSDHFHPNRAGYARIAARVAQALY